MFKKQFESIYLKLAIELRICENKNAVFNLNFKYRKYEKDDYFIAFNG